MRLLPTLTAAACILSFGAMAQTASPGGVSRPAGGIPPAAGGAGDRTGSITATGQTKPAGAPVGNEAGTRPDLDEKSRQLDRQISKGICKGC